MAEITSQTVCYIDFSATPSGSGGGSIRLARVKDAKIKDDKKAVVVKALGVNGGAGFRRTTGGGTLTLAVYRDAKPEVNYRQLQADKKLFAFTMQDENGGIRETFFPCTVSNVDRNDDEEGNHMDEVEIVFLGSTQSGGVAA